MKPHICVLGMVANSNINLGRQLLAECLIGENNERIKKLRLHKNVYYNSIPLYDKKDALQLIDLLLDKKYLELRGLQTNKFIKVLQLTEKGAKELENPTDLVKIGKKLDTLYSNIETVTEKDVELFMGFGTILEGLSDEQKKAVTNPSKSILCIAGAGSGKTKVLTKRAWFLSKYKDAKKILCITFTRKARQEMQERLDRMHNGHTIEVETFNSFCEKILRENSSEIYDKKYTVMGFKEKIELVTRILQDLNLQIDTVIDTYYTKRQLYSNDKRTLYLGFINDLFSLLDYQRNNYLSMEQFFGLFKSDYGEFAKKILIEIVKRKEEKGYRDFTDQLSHALRFFREKKAIPQYDHILIDEFQDINTLQFELIMLLKAENMFAVGDPRQAIYGWRESKIEFILDFEKLFPGSSILQLSTNYRSHKKIVELCNSSIKSMRLPNIIPSQELEGNIALIEHDDEEKEAFFIAQSILSLDEKRNGIFVLTRTNRQLEKISESLSRFNIKYVKRTVEDTKQSIQPGEDEITLSTIHAIKGLEAETVYVAGASAKFLPCHASEHPLLESIKEDYDKYEEERRLLYVAMSRAKSRLVINYYGKITPFLEGLF